MTVVQTVWIIVPILYLCTNGANGDIYSTELMDSMSDKWIDMNSVRGSFVKRSLSRYRRAQLLGLEPVVTEFQLENDTSHNQALIHWSGNGSEVIFILTRRKTNPRYNEVSDSTLWRSKNYGKDYKRMSDAFLPLTILKSYFISPTNKSKVVFVDAYNQSRRLYLSFDEGETYEHVDVPFSVEKIDFHPANSDRLLGYDKFGRKLYCSMDFGYTWTKLGNEVTSDRYYWYVKNVDKGNDAENIVFFEYRHIPASIINRIYKVKSCYVPDCTPTAFQAKLDKLENIDQDSLVVQNSYVFVQKSGAANKLYVSHNRGEFSKALFPYYASRSQAHFHIVSSDGGCVVIGISHDNGLTHLFFSEEEGKKYTQSLSNVRYFNKKTTDNKVFSVDIYKIQGIIGTYIANVQNADKHNTTKITWNNGRTWSNITTGVYGINKQKQTQATCDKCSLNLHLTMEQTPYGYYMQSILAKTSYPGIIVAHGSYSRTVEDRPSDVFVYISRDNGHSWHAVQEKRHFVVVSNHGAVIVMVRMIFGQPVQMFSFSSNYGKDFSDHSFTANGHAINVDGILTEPGEKKPLITLFGHETYHDSWKVYQIDVSPLFPKVCQFPNDFMNVTIPFGSSSACHLGMRQQFEKLNNGQNCLVQSNYSRVTTVKRCDCTMDDYECDLGYESVKKGGKLTCMRQRLGRVDHVSADMHEAYANAVLDEKTKCDGDKRKVPSGLRKVPGNRCIKEVTGIYSKLESCNPETSTTPTTTSPQLVHIERQNVSNIMKMGDVVVFSVQGVDSDAVVWRVSSKNEEKKLPQTDDNFNFGPSEPGEYIIRAEIMGTSVSSQWETVQFWYPIQEVHLYHPPVIAHERFYNVTAWTQTVYKQRGHSTLVGEVGYLWYVTPSGKLSKPRESKENFYYGKSPNDGASAVQITVTADNRVSQRTTTGKILVTEFFVQLVMEMKCTPAVGEKNLSNTWLGEFQSMVAEELLQMKTVQAVQNKYSLTHNISMYIHVTPGSPLMVSVYLAPTKAEHSKDKLLEAAKQLEAIVAEPPFSVGLAKTTATMSKLYVIDYDGTTIMYEPYSAANGTVIAVAVVSVALLLVVGVFVFRHFSRKMRFDRYLHFRNLRPGNPRNGRIVRNQDRNPIVEEEFIDDDLNAMEDIGAQDGALQFQG